MGVRYNSAPNGQILREKIWACRARRALSNKPGPVFLGAIVSERKIKKFFFPLFPLNRFNSAPIGQILTKKYGRVGRGEPFQTTTVRFSWVLQFRRKKLLKKKFFFPLFHLNRYNSAPIGRDEHFPTTPGANIPFKWPSPVFLGAIVSEIKIKKFFFPLFPFNRYNSAPIGQILIKKIWAYRARRVLSNDSGPVFLGTIVSAKKIKKFFFPLFRLNRYNSAPVGQILIKKIWTCRTRRALSNDPSTVFLGAIVSEKKIVKEKIFFPLFPLNRYNSAPIGQILIKKVWACRARRALSYDPGPLFLGAIVSENKIILTKKIWACRARRALSIDPGPVFLDAIVSEKKIKKFFFFVHFKAVITRPLMVRSCEKKYGRVGREEPFPTNPVRARRALSNDHGPVLLPAIVSEKKIVKEEIFYSLFPLNRYNSPLLILITKIWACRARRALSNDPRTVFLGSIVSEEKIKKFFFPLFPLNRYNSAPVGQILTKKIWACRARRALSNDPGPVFLDAIVSEKKIFKAVITRPLMILREKIWACRARRALSNKPGPVFLGAIVSERKIKKFFFPLFPLNRFNSAPIGQILTKKYGRVGRGEPFQTTTVRFSWVLQFRRKKLLKKKFFFPLFHLNRYNSAPIGRDEHFPTAPGANIPFKWPSPVFLGAIVSEIKIKKFFFPLFPLNRYNSAPIGQILIQKIWAYRARRALSNDSGPVFLGTIVSAKKIKKFFFPLFRLNRYNSAPVGQILIKKIWTCRTRRALSNDPSTVFLAVITRPLMVRSCEKKYGRVGREEPFPINPVRARRALSNDHGPVLLAAIVSEKKIVKEEIFYSLFHLNRYNSAPIGQILIKKIWACRARRVLSNDRGPVFLGAIVSKKKIKKFFLPLFPLNRYKSALIGQILIKSIWACRARRALSNDPGPVFLGAIVSEKKIKKFCLPLFPLNRYNSAPIGQILIKKIWACRARRALSNDPGSVFLGAIVSKKFCLPLFPLNHYNSAPIGQILIKKIWACRARRALSNNPGTVFLGAIVSEKKIKKFFLPLSHLNRYNSAPIGQILIKKIWAWREEPFPTTPTTVFLGAIVSEKKIVKEKILSSFVPFKPLYLGSYWSDLDKKNMGVARRALSNDPGSVFLGAIVSEKKIVKEKILSSFVPLNRYNSAAIGQILIEKIWACRARRALSNDPGTVFLGAIVSEKKIKKFCLPLYPLNRYNSAPIGQILIKKIRACRARRALSNDPGPVFLGAVVSEKKIKKFCLPLIPLNRYNSAPIGQILIKKIWACRARRALSNDPGTVFLGAIVSEIKIKKFFFPLFPFNRYNSAPIGQILIKKIWAYRARRALSNDSGPVFLGTIVSAKKIKKFFFPLFRLNRYNSAPVGQILIKKIWTCRTRRALSNDPSTVFLGAIVSEKKIVKEKIFFPLFPLNRYNSAPIGQILIKKVWACRARRALSYDPGPLFLGAIVSENKIILTKKIWACRARRALSNDPGPVFLDAIVSEKKIKKFFFFVHFKAVITRPLMVRSCEKKYGRVGREEPFPTNPVRARRALSNDHGPVLLAAIVSEKKIVKEEIFYSLFPLNRYNSPLLILITKIWACRARRALSNDPRTVFLGSIVSEEKIKKFFFPLFPLNRYNSAPVGQILTKKIWACRARRALSNDPGPVFLDAIVSEKKIFKAVITRPLMILREKIWACRARRALSNKPGPVFLGAIVSERKIKKFFFPLFPLNRFNSAPIGQILTKKYGRVGRGEPFQTTTVRFSWVLQFRRKKLLKKKFFFPLFHLNRYNSAPIGRDEHFPTAPVRGANIPFKWPSPVFLGAIVSEIKIKKFCLPLFPLNRYNSAPIGQILIKKIWACRARRALSNDPGPVFLGAIVSKKFCLPLFPLNHYNSAPIGQILIKKIWACRARRALSNDPGTVFLGAIVSEKKIKKFFLPLSHLNRYNSAPIGQILIKKIWACRARRALSNDPTPVFLGAIVSEKKIKKFCLPLFPLNRYTSAPIGQILIKKIWACRARRALSNDPGSVFLGAIVSEKKIKKFCLPLIPLNRYNSAPIGQILIEKIWACRAGGALSNDPSPVFLGAIVSEKKIKKFCLPLIPLNRYNSAPISQILIKKIWACRARRALSNDPGTVFLGAIVSEKKIVKKKILSSFVPFKPCYLGSYWSDLDKKNMGVARRALSNVLGPVFLGAIVSEKKIKKFFLRLFPLNRYNSAPIGQILIKKYGRVGREEPFPMTPVGKKLLNKKFCLPLFPLNRYNSAPIGQILKKEIWACRARRALSNDPGPVFLGAIVSEKKIKKFCLPLFPLNRYNSAPVGQILIKKIWTCRTRRALSNDPSTVFLAVITRPLMVRSCEKKYGRVGREEPFPINPVRARRALSNDHGPVLLAAIVSEKKIVKEEIFYSLFPLNRYNSAPIGQILIKKIWACRARRVLSNDRGPVFLGAIVSKKKIKKFFLPLFPLNRYKSALIGQILIKSIWACRARRALSNDPCPVFLGAIVSEKKIKKFCLPLFPLNRYNSAPIGQILIKKIWACRARRALSNDPGSVFLGAIVSKKFCLPLFPLNHYNSAPIGQILIKKIWACRARRALSNNPGTVFLGAIVSEKKIKKFFLPLSHLNRYNSAPIGQILIKKIWAWREEPFPTTPTTVFLGAIVSEKKIVKEKILSSFVPFKPLYLGSYWSDLDKKNMGVARRALSNDPGSVFLGAIVSEKKIVKEKILSSFVPLNRYNSAAIGQILIEKIWACRARRALSNDPGTVFLGAIVSEKKIKKFCLPLYPLNRYNSAPIGQILIKKIRACRARRALSNDPGPVFLGAVVSEKKIKKFCLPLIPLNRYNSAPIGQILIKKIWACRARRALSNDPGKVFLGAIVSEIKIKKFFFPLFPFNRYNSAPIGQILIKKIWAYRARRALSNDSGPVFLGTIVSAKKIKKFFFPLFRLNRYNSAPVGQILIKKIWTCRTRRALSNDPSTVFLGAIVSEKKIVKEKIFFPLFPLNRYNSAPIGQILIKKVWACRARRALSYDPGPLFLGAIVSENKIILTKKIWACRARRALSNDPGPVFLDAIVSEKKIKKFFFFVHFKAVITRPLMVRSCEKKYGRVGREEPFPTNPVRARRALSNDHGPVLLAAIVSEKKIVKEEIFYSLFPLNRYNSPLLILITKIWACRARRALSNDPRTVFLGSIVSEEKIKKFFFPLFPLNRYNSAPVGQILTKKIWACRARRALSNDPGPVFLDAIVSEKKIFKAVITRPLMILREKIWACRARRALSNKPGPVFLGAIVSERKIVIEKIFLSSVPFKPARRALSNDHGPVLLAAIVSEKKIVKEEIFYSLFPLNRYNSAPIDQILIKKIWACRARRVLSNDRGPVFLGAIVSKKKIKKFFLPLFPLNRYKSALIGQILIKSIWACRARRALSNDPGPVFLGAIVSEKKIKKFCLPLFPLNRYNSAPIGQILIKKIWACRARRALSNDPGSVFLGAIVSKKFCLPLFPLNHYNSAPIGQILIKKIWACRARRALSNNPGTVFLGAIVSEKKIKKFFLPLSHLNRYNSAPIGQILIKKIWAWREEPFPTTPTTVFLGAIVSEKKIKKFCLPLFPLNRYTSAPIGQILIKKIWACRARRALSNDPGSVFLGAIVSEKKIKKFCLPLIPLNRYNSAPIGQILIKKIWACRARRALSNDPGTVFLGAIVSEIKIKKFFFPLFPFNRYNSAPIGQILIKKIWAYRARRALSNDSGPVFLGTIVSAKKIKKFFFPLFRLNRYNSAPVGQILIKKIWTCRTRRALSNDPSTVFLGAIVSEKKIVKEKIFFPLFPLNRYNSAPIGQILIKKVWACRARRALSYDPGPLFLGAIVSENKIILTKKIWACRARRALSNDPGPVFLDAIVSEKKIKKFFFFVHFKAVITRPLMVRSCEKKYGRVGREEPFPTNPVRARRALSNDHGPVLLAAIVSEKKIVKEEIFYSLFPLNRYNSPLLILITKIWACRARRALSNDPRTVFLGSIVSEEKIKKFFFPLFPLNRYNSAPVGQILTKKIWACRARRALSNDPGPVFLDAIVSEKKIFKAVITRPLMILREKIWACRARRALSNKPGPVFLGAIVSERKIKKFFFPLFPLNRFNSAPIGQILTKKYGRVGRGEPFQTTTVRFSWVLQFRRKKLLKKKFFFPLFHLNRYNSAPIGRDEHFPTAPVRGANIPFKWPSPVFLGAIVSEIKIKKFCLPLFPLNRYNSAPIGQILIKKIWACRARRALSNDPGPVFLGAIVSKKFCLPLFPLNHYNSAPIGQILIKKIWACRARRALSNDPGTVFLGAIVSEKKIKKFFLPLSHLNRYNSAPIGQILIKKIWACRARRALSNDPTPVFLGAIVSEKKIKKFCLPLFPLNRYTSAPIGQILIKKIWACRARRALSNDPGSVFLGAIVSEKKIKKFCLPLIPLNRYNSAPIGQILIEKIWACRAGGALSNDPSPVFLGAIVSEKKIKKFCLPLIPLNRYNSAPISQILIKKIWACRARRALSNDPGTVFLGAIVSEKKIVKKKILSSFVPFKPCYLGSYWSDLDKKNMGVARRALSNVLGPVFLGAIVSEKKIKKFFLRLFPLNRYNSAPIGQILIKKYGRVGREEPFPMIPVGKKLLNKKFCLPLFPLNRYNSAPIGQILKKEIWACRARRALSNDPGPVFLGAIVSEKKIKKFCLPLFPLNRYNSAPIGQILIKKIWACRARRALSNDPGSVFLGAIVSEKKIVKEKIFSSFVPFKPLYLGSYWSDLDKKNMGVWGAKSPFQRPRKKLLNKKFCLPLFHLNRATSAPIGQILIKKIWACRARRALSNVLGPVFLGAIVSEKKIKKFLIPLFPLNRYTSAPIGQILIKKIWACRARRALSNDPGPVFLGAIVSEKKIKKFCLPLFPLNRYNSAPIGQILIKKIWACRARRALSNDPGPKKFCLPLFPLNRYNSAPIGQILIKKIWACRARRALSNDPDPVFLGAIVSEKKIKKFCLPLFPLNRYNSAPIGQILIKKIWACRARRALSNDPGSVFLGAIVSEKKIKKFFLPLSPLNRATSAPIGQILIKKIWACRARRALSNDPGPVFLGAIVSEKKIVKEKFCLPLFPLSRATSAPIGQILIKKIWACRARRTLSNDPGPVFLGAIVSEKKIVKEKFCLPLFPLSRATSAPIGQILIKKIWACRARRTLSNDPGPVFLGAIVSEKKIVKEKFCLPLFPLNRYNSAPIGQILIEKIWACRARRALSNDPGTVFLGAIVSEKKIKKFCLPLIPLNRYNSAPIGQILIKKIWACRARRTLSNDPGPVFLGAIVSEKKIVKEKFCLPLFPLSRYNWAPIGQILIEKIWACRPRRALSNDPGPVFLGAIVSEKKIVKEKILSSFDPFKPARRALSNDSGTVFLGAIVSEKKIKKFCLPLFPLNRATSAPIGQILIKKIWACRARRALSNDPGPVFLGAIVSEKKIKKFCLLLFPLNRYNSAPIGQILIKKIWACRARRVLSNDRGPVFLGAIVSKKKIKKFFLPLFPLNRYKSALIGQILIKRIWACRARRALSNDPGPVFLGAIVSEKKIKKFCLPLFPLNRYNSAPIGQILIKKIWACRARRALSNDPGPVFLGAIVSEKKIVKKKFCLPLFPLNRYNSAPIGQILIKKIWACRARRALSNDPGRFRRKKLLNKKFCLPLFPLNRYNSAPIGQILIKEIWACRARRALSNDPGPVFLGAIVSEKKIKKFCLPLFPLNRYNSAPIGQILIKKIWACRARRALSNDPGPVFLGAIVSEKKIKKFCLPLFPLNRHNSAPIGQISIKKICACRARRALSNDPGPVFLGAIVSEKKIVKEKFCLPLFPLNRYNSAPIGQILIKEIWACRARRALSNDPGQVFLGAIVSEKKIVKEKILSSFVPFKPARRALSNDPGPVFLGAIVSEKKIKKFCLPLFPLNRYNSAPIGQILIKKIWACRARRVLSNDRGPVFLGAIVSEKKIKKFCLLLFPLNRYNSAPIGQILIKKIWACRARRALSNDPGPVFLDAIVSEKKIVKKKFCLPLFPLNRYTSAPIGQILIKKIWACRARRVLSNDRGPVFLGAIVSKKKIKKFFLPLFPLNRYKSALIGQILIKRIWACRARRALSNDPGPVFLGAIVSEKKIKKFCLPLFPLNRYNSAPIGQILIKKIWACRARRALSNDPGPVFLGAIVSEKKIVKKKFCLPLFPLNRYNSAPIGQILIKKIWACRARRALSNDPGPVFLGAIVSEKKIVKKKIFSSFVPFKPCYLGSYWSDLDKKNMGVARRALSNVLGPVFLGAIVSEKKIKKFFLRLFPLNRYNSAPIGQILIKKYGRVGREEPFPMTPVGKKLLNKKFCLPLFPLNRYNSAPIGQILIKEIWACRARRALSNDPGPVFLGAIVSEKKIKKFCLPLFPLNRYNSAPIGQILIKKIWACRARRALSNDPGPVFLGAIVSEKKIKKFCLPLFPLNRHNSAPIGQISIKKICACRARRALSNDPGPVFLGAIVSEKKIVKEKFCLPLFPLNRYNSAPIGQILIKEIWACRARRALSNDPGQVFLGAIVSEKKIVKEKILSSFVPFKPARRALSNDPGPVFLGAIVSEKKIKKFCLPLFPLNRYNSAPIGQILIKKIWACRARRVLSNDRGPVFLGAIVSEKKIKKFCLLLFPLNRYNSAPIGQILIKKIWACRARRALSNDPGPVFLDAIVSEKKIVKEKILSSFVPFKPLYLGSYWSDLDKKNMGVARRALSNDPGPVFLGAIVSEKKIVKEKILSSFVPFEPLYLGSYSSDLDKKNMARRALSNDPGPVFLGAIVSEKKIVKQKIFSSFVPFKPARRALSNHPGPVFLGAIVSEKKIKKFCLPLIPLNRYNSAPIGQILIKKIWACRARRALSNDPGPVFLGAIVSEKKIVKKKFCLPLFPLNRYNSAPIGQILIKKNMGVARRALSSDPGPVFLGAIVSEKKIKKFCLPLFPLNRYNSAPIGQILIKKIWACRARRALSSDPGPVFLGAIVSEKKIVKKKFCLPLFPLNRYNSAPIGQILIKKIWACRARRALSNDPVPVFLGAIVSEKKIKKFFLPSFPLNRYNSAPIGQILIKKIWACRARRALSNDPGPVFLGAIVSEKKIKKFCLPLIPLNRYNSAPIGQILIKKIWACRARRALSNDLGTVFLGAIVSEKKIVKKKFCLLLFPLNRYNSAPIGQILIKKNMGLARRALSNDPGPVFLGAIVSEKKIKKFCLPLFPLNRYTSAPIGQILIKKKWACRARRALSNDPGPVFLGAIVSEKKIKKFFLPLFPLNRYNSAPIGQILIKKIWACRARRALSNDPGPVFLGVIVSEKKIKKFCLPLIPLNRYNSAPIGQILIKKIWACRARRALSNDPGPVFLGAIVSEKKIVKKKFCLPLFPLSRYNSAPIGQILIKKIWACRARRALSNDPGPVFLGAIVSEKKIVKEKFCLPLFPLSRYNSAPIGQILIEKIWACRARRALSNDPGPVFLGAKVSYN
ncbi:LOW QUALITY PROTEIN: hypothetical protein V1477_000086 [Vespula maculifrons]|uniref:Uncharacterized protein n=1 Tax=Vespula maculifrons TaxID=7453 RepID=A0ABD2D2J7_VESMC